MLKDIAESSGRWELKVDISSDENGGKVMCLGPIGKRAIAGAVLEIGESGGVVGVRGGEGGSAGLAVAAERGRVTRLCLRLRQVVLRLNIVDSGRCYLHEEIDPVSSVHGDSSNRASNTMIWDTHTLQNLKGASIMFRLREKLDDIIFMGSLVLADVCIR